VSDTSSLDISDVSSHVFKAYWVAFGVQRLASEVRELQVIVEDQWVTFKERHVTVI